MTRKMCDECNRGEKRRVNWKKTKIESKINYMCGVPRKKKNIKEEEEKSFGSDSQAR